MWQLVTCSGEDCRLDGEDEVESSRRLVAESRNPFGFGENNIYSVPSVKSDLTLEISTTRSSVF